jgi:hypothetical protein
MEVSAKFGWKFSNRIELSFLSIQLSRLCLFLSYISYVFCYEPKSLWLYLNNCVCCQTMQRLEPVPLSKINLKENHVRSQHK